MRKLRRKIARLFDNLLIALAVVFVWRGVWGLLDKYFFPLNDLLSYGLCILIGLILLYFHRGDFRELL